MRNTSAPRGMFVSTCASASVKSKELSRAWAVEEPLPSPLFLSAGALVVKYVIEVDGRVGRVAVMQSLHPIVDKAWVKALKRFRYRPAIVAQRIPFLHH